MEQLEGGHVATSARMPPRKQATPFGDVTLTSRPRYGRHYLVATGPAKAVQWLFPDDTPTAVSPGSARYEFAPDTEPVTDARKLRSICREWQEGWNERLYQHQEQSRCNAPEERPPTALREVFEFHQRYHAQERAASTQWKYPLHMRDWFELLGKDVALSSVSTEGLLDARRRLRERLCRTPERPKKPKRPVKKKSKPKKPTRLKDSTVNGRFATLKTMLNLALAKGWIARDCWSSIEDLKVIPPATRYWSRSEVSHACAAAAEDEHASVATLMLVLGIHLGLRKNEAVNLRWEDLDLDRVHPETGQPSPVCRIQQRPDFRTKTYENRIVPVSPEAKRLLLAHRSGGTFVLEPHRDLEWLEERRGSKRVYRYDTAKLWARVLKRAIAKGASRIPYHAMRATFASLCLKSGRSAEEVARWLGHRDTRMVRQHYAHLIEFDQAPDLAFLA